MQAIVDDIYSHEAFFIFSIKQSVSLFPSFYPKKMTFRSNSLSPSFIGPLLLFLSQSLQALEQIPLEIFKTLNTDAHP